MTFEMWLKLHDDGYASQDVFEPKAKVVACRVEAVISWGQRAEPKPQTPIYQNTPETDVVPPETGIVLSHDWSEVPASATDRVGIYLGNNLVLLGELS